MPETTQVFPGRKILGTSVLCVLVIIGILFPMPHLHAGATSLQRYEFSLQRMGTMFEIILYAPSQNEASLAAGAQEDRRVKGWVLVSPPSTA